MPTASERPMRSIAPFVHSSGESDVEASRSADLRVGSPDAPCVSYSRSIFLSSAFQLMISVTGGSNGRKYPAQVRRRYAAQGNARTVGCYSAELSALREGTEHRPNSGVL